VVVLAVTLGTAFPGVLHGQNADVIGLPLGSRPPAVTLEDLDGQPVDLARWIGTTPVLFEFWALWCPQCRELLPRIEAARARFGERMQFVIVAVGVNQSPRSVRRHAEGHALPGVVLWDGRGEAVRAFRAPTTSYVVILDAAGRVVYTGTGGDQDVAAGILRAVK
jgi:thiol-disulfide isomerase/thioredoxin